jgi:O-antigen polymerase
MMLKEYINTTLQLTIVLFLFLSAFLVKPEFFNGIVTGKQYGLELAALCMAGYLIFFLPFRKSIRVTRVDTGIIILCLWYLLGEIINGFPFISVEHAVFSIGLWMSIYLFTRQSSGKPVFVWGVICIWLAMILVQALMGLMQLHGKAASHHYLFNITGTFHNPGPFAGFIISALPLALGVILALQQVGYSGTKDRNLKLWKWQVKLHDNAFYLQKAIIFLCYGVIILLMLVIPAARSRAAWMAGLAGSAYLLLKHPAIAGYRDKVIGLFSRMSFFPRLMVIISCLYPAASCRYGSVPYEAGLCQWQGADVAGYMGGGKRKTPFWPWLRFIQCPVHACPGKVV